MAQNGATLILLPEKILTVPSPVPVLQEFQHIAEKNSVYLIAGLDLKESNQPQYNAAYVFSPDNRQLLHYDKQHFLPPFESSYIPGTDLVTIPNGTPYPWGVEICKDMDFSHPARSYGSLGTGLMLVPALDFHLDAWTHARIAILRGVEQNFSVVRAGQWGLLTVSDSRGRLLASQGVDTTTDPLLLSPVIPGTGNSPYSLGGDWFPLLCSVLWSFAFAAALVIHFRSYIRS